jgi:hypothetical protein
MLDMAIAELRRVGIKPVEDRSRKHVRITWKYQGRDRVVVVAGTPSDVRALKNNRAQVRRLLREDGLL